MINTTAILEVINNAGVLSENEYTKIEPFCVIAANLLSDRLKSEDFASYPAVIGACAAIALYNFLLANSTTEDFSSFKAGDITVKHNREARIENAAKFKNESLICAAPYLMDIDFVFEAVEV